MAVLDRTRLTGKAAKKTLTHRVSVFCSFAVMIALRASDE